MILLVLPVPFLEKLRVVSAGVCAQRVGHSILFGGVQPPLEARMIGIYGGFMVAALGFALFGRAKSVIMAPVPILAISLLFVAVMGFDDSAVSTALSPALTTVRQPSLTQGRYMASVLLDILAGRPAAHATILPTEVIERGSA